MPKQQGRQCNLTTARYPFGENSKKRRERMSKLKDESFHNVTQKQALKRKPFS